jgi:hypothetical protein
MTDTKKETKLFFIFVCKEYVLCTTEIDSCEDTIDINFEEFSSNYELLTILHLCTALLRPTWQWQSSLGGERLLECTAYYLAAFDNDKESHNKKRDYMLNNGIIRILPTSDEIKKKLKEWWIKQNNNKI